MLPELQQKAKNLNLDSENQKDPSLNQVEPKEEEIEEVPSPTSPVSVEDIIDTATP